MKIYETVVKEIGSEAGLFKEEQMLILFGENAPDSLKNYCYIIEVELVEKQLDTEMVLHIDDCQYRLTAIGGVVTKNLQELGHITIKFDAAQEPELPGTLHVAKGIYPELVVGSRIWIDTL